MTDDVSTYNEDHDALAAEYVLGTLSADERDKAEALIAIDPTFAQAVRQWERRLGELNVMVDSVEPPPEVWDKIKTGVVGISPTAAFHWAPEKKTAASDTIHFAPAVETVPATELKTKTEGDTLLAAALAISPPRPETEPEAAKAMAEAPAEAPVERAWPPAPPRIERSADVIYLAARARRWRRVTLLTGALAAVLAIYIGLSRFEPDLLGRYSASSTMAHAPGTAAPQGSRLVAALEQGPISPAFLVTVDIPSRTLTVRRVSATPEADRSYELWLIAKQSPTPRSLGIVGKDEFTQRPLPADFDLDTIRAASYAVSLEPAGGSPSGVPTGPILFTGKLVESLPAPPPAPKT